LFGKIDDHWKPKQNPKYSIRLLQLRQARYAKRCQVVGEGIFGIVPSECGGDEMTALYDISLWSTP
jgi:hypothetical protein